MTRLASWADYGTHDESAYPELWRGCVGAWAPCLGPTGLRVFDLSRYRTNADAISGVPAANWTLSLGRFAWTILGAADYLDCGSASHLPLDGSFSLSAWIYPTLVNGFRRFASIGEFNTGWIAGVTNTGKLDLTVNASSIVVCYGNTTLTASQWVHAAMIVDNTNKLLRVFLNGREDVTPVSFSGTVTRAATPLQFGRSGASSTNQWSGSFDDIRLYSRVLSIADIRLLATRRGIAYERRKRRSVFFDAAFFNAAWARNSNVILSPVGAA